MRGNKYLMDIVLIRLTLIFLLIFYHAFCPFTGGWPELLYEDFPDNVVYKWIGLLSHNFQLESMAFISGLLVGYTLTLHPEKLNFKSCVIKKMKRILLPSFLFSIAYYLLFFDLHAPWNIIISKLLNGCGHLWFLPMIFWCFVACYIFERTHFFSTRGIFILCVIALFFPTNDTLFGLGRFHHFFIYFYWGFAIKRGYFTFKSTNKKIVLISLLILYMALCVAYEVILTDWFPIHILERYIRALCLKIIHPLCAFSMIVFLYNLANRPTVKSYLSNHLGLISLSGYCYGVYIYQQFILKYLYYKTTFPFHVSPELLPWTGFVFTLILSLVFCHFTLKTKVGKFLIG